MNAYFDTSAVIKLVVSERGSDVADELWAAADVRFASRLVYPEARAALAATGRVRGYDAVHLATALASSGSELVMVTWDRELALAALACGHPVAPPL